MRQHDKEYRPVVPNDFVRECGEQRKKLPSADQADATEPDTRGERPIRLDLLFK